MELKGQLSLLKKFYGDELAELEGVLWGSFLSRSVLQEGPLVLYVGGDLLGAVRYLLKFHSISYLYFMITVVYFYT